MALITLGPTTSGLVEKYYIAWIGPTTTINSTNFPWYTFDKVAGIYGISANKQSYISNTPQTAFPAVTKFTQASAGSLPNIYELDLKGQITLETTQIYLLSAAATITQLASPAGYQASPLTSSPQTALSVTASSVANASGYQLYTSATQTGTYAKLGGVLATPSYNHTGLSAGLTQWYKWQAVGDGTSYTDSALSNAFSGSTQASEQAVKLTPTLADLSYNVRQATDTGVPPHSAASSVFTQVTNVSYVDVEYYNSREVPALRQAGLADPFGITLNNPPNLRTSFLAEGVGTFTKRLTFNAPYTGILEFLEGVQEHNTADAGDFGYTTIQSLTFPAGSKATLQKPAAKSDVLIVLGDSITVGIYASHVGNGWIPQLRRLRTNMDIYSDGYGYRSLKNTLTDAAARAAIIANAKRVFGSATTKRYYVALGTNDLLIPFDISNVDLIGTLYDEMVAQIPDVIFYVQTLLDYTSTPGVDQQRYASFQSRITAQKTSARDKMRLMDGKALVSAANLADGYHPYDAGYSQQAQGIHARLDLAPATLVNNVSLLAATAGNTPSNWLDTGGGNNNATQSATAMQPQLLTDPVTSRLGYFFAKDGQLRRLLLNPLAATQGAYTITYALRSISTAAGQFPVDIPAGRLAGIIGGPQGGTASYYEQIESGQANGFYGPNIAANADFTVVSISISDSSTNVYLNGQPFFSGPANIAALNGQISLGSAYDATSAAPGNGQFYGYLFAQQFDAGAFTAQQAVNRYNTLLNSPKGTTTTYGPANENSATAPPSPTGNYDRVFTDLAAGSLNGQDGWTTYTDASVFQVDKAVGLSIFTAASYAVNARGALLSGSYGDGEVALLVDIAYPTALLRWHHDTSTDKCHAVYCYKVNNTYQLDAAILQGGTVTAYTGGPTGLPALSGENFWISIRTIGAILEVRTWNASQTRPSTANYSHTLANNELLGSGQIGLGCIENAARVLELKVIS